MPRLLSLNTYHYRRGGSDAVYFDHDRLFQKAGWETAVFAMHHPNNEPSDWSDYFANELEFGEDYSLSQQAIMATKVVYSFEARKKLSRLLERFLPDIAHAHCIYHHLSPSVLGLLHSRGIPTVMTAHDLKLACPAYKMLNRQGICEKCKNGNLAHLVFNRCIHNSLSTSALVAIESAVHKSLGLYKRNLDKIVTPSHFFYQKLKQWGWKEEQLVYIPNFLDCSSYLPNYTPGRYFLYFGRLAQEKGVDTLIRASAKVDAELHIAGTGPFEKELRSVAEQAGANAHFHGYCSGDTLWNLIRGCRATVLPSQWYENAPISILESYAIGKPVIGARIGGIPEMVLENETGSLYASGSSDELAEVLENTLSLPEKRVLNMGQFARNFVENTFSPRLYRDNMMDLYASLGVAVGANIINR